MRSCEHAQDATLLWLYGEGPAEHAVHVAECSTCSEVAEQHAQVIAVVGPTLRALKPAHDDLGALAPPSTVRKLAPYLPALLAFAAMVVLVLSQPRPGPTTTLTPATSEVASAPPRHTLDSAFSDDLDRRLDDVALDLDFLSLSLGTL